MHSIQFTLRQVTELILRHKIDLKEAGLILYALQIASSNLKRLELDEPEPEDVTTDAQIEHPVETPEQAEAFKELQADEIDRIYGCASDKFRDDLIKSGFERDGLQAVRKNPPSYGGFSRKGLSQTFLKTLPKLQVTRSEAKLGAKVGAKQ